MRPSDENQPASRRPNLMSPPRRTSGEIHILAMLDGHAHRSLSRRLLALPKSWWYGAAGLLACTLVGVLTWLAGAGTGAKPRQIAATEPAAVVLADAGPVEASVPETLLPASDVPATDLPVAAVDAPLAAMGAEPAAAPVATPAAAAPAPARSRSAPPPGRRAAAGAAVTRAVHKVAVHAAAPASRLRRAAPVAKARSSAPAVDTDVALITAIIQHGGKPPQAEPNCPGGPCTFPLPER